MNTMSDGPTEFNTVTPDWRGEDARYTQQAERIAALEAENRKLRLLCGQIEYALNSQWRVNIPHINAEQFRGHYDIRNEWRDKFLAASRGEI